MSKLDLTGLSASKAKRGKRKRSVIHRIKTEQGRSRADTYNPNKAYGTKGKIKIEQFHNNANHGPCISLSLEQYAAKQGISKYELKLSQDICSDPNIVFE